MLNHSPTSPDWYARNGKPFPPTSASSLLPNVWCGHYCQEVTITNFSGTIKCGECHGEVVRVIEGP